jgi:ribosome biogenesis GTPase
LNLATLGWNPYFDRHFEQHRSRRLTAARVVCEHGQSYRVLTELGELSCQLAGRLIHGAVDQSDLPAVGDWVAIQPRADEGKATIHAVLPRKSAFSRKLAHSKTEEQVIAANVDTAFLVSGLDGELNVRRIERYLTLAWDSGATPVIVLNKTDLCSDLGRSVNDVESVALGVAIHLVSAKLRQGLDALDRYLRPGQTVALLGSSGVGKSTLLNRLLGTERQRTAPVRERDGKGRHATAHRELVFLPGGGMLIDNPGMRELQMWTDDEALAETFDDILLLATRCRFRDCRHDGEPVCAVREAIENGTLDEARLRSYRRLQREIRHLEARRDQKARLAERATKRQREKRSREYAGHEDERMD